MFRIRKEDVFLDGESEKSIDRGGISKVKETRETWRGRQEEEGEMKGKTGRESERERGR